MARGVFKSVLDILRANVVDLIEKAEQPEKMAKQMIREMEKAVGNSVDAVATATANFKRLDRQLGESTAEVDMWGERARKLVKKGKEKEARNALERKVVAAKRVTELSPLVTDATGLVEEMRNQLTELRGKLEEVKNRQGLLVARQQNAKIRKKMAKGKAKVDTGDAFSAFERMEEKTKDAELSAEAYEELAAESDGEVAKSAETQQEVEDELASLKEELTK